jgi:phosphoglycerate dehydrogenase-like enzyme
MRGATGRGLLQVGFLVSWRPHERALAEQACPPGMACRFLRGDPKGEAGTLGRLDVLVVGTQQVSASLIDAAPRLRLIQRWGTGLDNIDLAGAAQRGIATAELPGVNARSVSEFVVGAILALLRHLPDVTAAWAEGCWLGSAQRPSAHRLQGKIVGLLGFGAIGRDVARLLAGFSVEILYHDPGAPLFDGPAVRSVTKEQLLSACDILSVHLPLAPSTWGAIGDAEIARMKPSAILISVSRAGIVDEEAVRRAVRDGRLFAASFDNFDPEPLPPEAIRREPRILATPHMAGATVEGFHALLEACYRSIAEHATKAHPLSGSANSPTTSSG